MHCASAITREIEVMRALNQVELASVGGGAVSGEAIATGVMGTTLGLSVSSGVTGGSCAGIGAGGVVTGVGVMTVVPVVVAAGTGYYIGTKIEEHTGIGSAIGDYIGTRLGHWGICW